MIYYKGFTTNTTC